MRKLFSILILAALLQGCLAAGALAIGGAAGGAVASDERNMHTIASDDKISYLITRQMAANQDLTEQAHISVATYNGVVLLVGQAPIAALRAQAEQIARSMPNVRRVFDEVTLAQPTSAMRRSKDAAITTNVKTRLLTTTDIHSGQFKVVTEDGVVYLMGLTSRAQADAAAHVASMSSGVKQVVKLIEYTSD